MWKINVACWTIIGSMYAYSFVDLKYREHMLRKHCGGYWHGVYAYCDGSPDPPMNGVYHDLRKGHAANRP